MNWSDLTEREIYTIKRKRKNITLQMAANDIGVHQSYLSNWESGRLNPKTRGKIEAYKKYIDNKKENF